MDAKGPPKPKAIKPPEPWIAASLKKAFAAQQESNEPPETTSFNMEVATLLAALHRAADEY